MNLTALPATSRHSGGEQFGVLVVQVEYGGQVGLVDGGDEDVVELGDLLLSVFDDGAINAHGGEHELHIFFFGHVDDRPIGVVGTEAGHSTPAVVVVVAGDGASGDV